MTQYDVRCLFLLLCCLVMLDVVILSAVAPVQALPANLDCNDS
jgi:hypothetical protein